MKNRILTIALLLIATLAFSQNYLHESAVWTESSAECPPIGLCYLEAYTISLDGDTTINGITYFKTRKQGTEMVEDWVNDTIVSITPIDTYLDPIREEDGKLYRYRAFIDAEVLLHDFDLAVGDTAISNCGTPQVVDSIQIVWLGNMPRKKYYFTNNFVNQFYEGIGSSKGLFKTPCSAIGIESGSALECFAQEDHKLQISPNADCGITTSIQGVEQAISDFTIQPNPFIQSFQIRLHDQTKLPIAVRVMNAQGRKIYHNNFGNLLNNQQITLSNQAPGIYWVQLRYPNEVLTKKVIKVK